MTMVRQEPATSEIEFRDTGKEVFSLPFRLKSQIHSSALPFNKEICLNFLAKSCNSVSGKSYIYEQLKVTLMFEAPTKETIYFSCLYFNIMILTTICKVITALD